jgi:site-specific DNA-methyltransferase (adenine-specific)
MENIGWLSMEFKNHIFSGDCRQILKDLPSDSISCCITDPPYNYEFIGHKWNSEEINRRLARVNNSKTLVKNIPYGSGLAGGVRNKRWYERVRSNILDYQEWCYEWGSEVFRVCKPGALVAIFNSTRTSAHVQIALERAGFYSRDCIVYRRHSGIPRGDNLASALKQKGIKDYEKYDGWHSCLRNEWEAIVILQKPLEDNYINTYLKYDIGYFYTKNDDDSFQSNILENIPRDKNADYNVHCTVKPLALMEKLIDLLVPKSNDHIVLDPFAGSGTTLVAAKKLGRSYLGIEIVPEYIEIIRQRLSEVERDTAKYSSTDEQSYIQPLLKLNMP